jgi:hypothetical protein
MEQGVICRSSDSPRCWCDLPNSLHEVRGLRQYLLWVRSKTPGLRSKALAHYVEIPRLICVALMSILKTLEVRSEALAVEYETLRLVYIILMSILKALGLYLEIPSLICVVLMSILKALDVS